MKGVLVILAVLAAVTVQAQPLPVRLYGDSLDEQAHALVEAADSGFCIAGWTKSYGPGTPNTSNVLVIKTDPQGAPVWAKISIGWADDEAYSMVKTYDNGYTLCGMTRSFGVGLPAANIFVAKFSANGSLLWSYVYGGEEEDIPLSIVETFDRGFALTGLTHSYGPLPTPNIFVLKLDSTGLFQWFRVYWMSPNHREDEGRSIVQTLDSGYVICGRAKVTSPSNFDAYLLKLNGAGRPSWVRVVPGDSNEEASSVAIDNMRNIFVAGWTNSYTPSQDPANLFVGIFNYAGALQGSWNYGWPGGSEKVINDRSLIAAPDTTMVVCGPTTSVGPGTPNPNFLIMKINLGGGIIWARSHPSAYDPGYLNDVPLPIARLSWGGYAVAGYTNSYPQRLRGYNFILSTFDARGNRPVCADSQLPESGVMVWVQGEVADSGYQPVVSFISFEDIEVQYDSVCYDTSGGGVKQGSFGHYRQSLSLRVVGRELELELSRAAQVNLTILGVDGRVVSELIKRDLNPGRNRIKVPEGVADGVYFVRANAGMEMATAKLVRY